MSSCPISQRIELQHSLTVASFGDTFLTDMKNRILWIFDSAEPEEELPPASDTPDGPGFEALPWALFGLVGAEKRAELIRKQQLDVRRNQFERAQREEEAQRFERLLADLEI